ncbi:hypothetical protein GOP47_0017027 [Adiantum capillus-veneris]|uniref:Membrane insertase YidC/Oxa/ALB C-terminal domain-containing protein n=1 Tax=Adiantum capillus-veneris TaxID=13818 RepID=A0A9D4UJH8_ADICA|nr:hypothetical protein GOP47_0016351 [Adiantum capillus-veneris]KAI5068682.1 hypothetical protein GOP47_0017027 [Adiantum capillus-veneris]
MATSLSTQFISTPTCCSRPRLASPLCFSASSAFRSLTFDPFRSRRRVGFTGNVFLVRSSMESVEAASELMATSFPHLAARAEGFLYTLADAAVSADPAVADSATQASNTDWLSGITNVLESFLKILQDGLQTVHVPYSFGFAIIMLTVIVKALTLPLTQKQVESSMAMQNLSPKVKAIQERYAGDKERIQLETSRLYKQAGVNPLAGCLPTLATFPVWIGLYRALSNVANEGLLTEGFFWVPSLAGPTTIAARQSGSGISWLFPFVDGQPPLGWHDTVAYLVLPVLLVASQFASMQLMQTPQSSDPSQKNTQLILKFLPLMIGYFSLSVPSGLSLYWFVNNLLSTAQQIYLRKLGGARLAEKGEIITAGQALRSSDAPVIERKERRGERFKQLKAEKAQRKAEQAIAVKPTDNSVNLTTAATSESDVENDGVESDNIASAKDSLEEIYSKSEAAATSAASKRSKRSKRRRSA